MEWPETYRIKIAHVTINISIDVEIDIVEPSTFPCGLDMFSLYTKFR
jgi:hypothetical protein